MKGEQTMKKNRLFMMAGALCAALGLGSCSNEMEEVAVPADGATRTVTLTVSLPGGGAGTRTEYAADGAGLKVTWAAGDKLTAVSESRDFTKSTTFSLTSGAGETTATFTGEIPEDVSEGDEIRFFYPEIKQEIIDGETHYIHSDYRTQDGTLAGLSKVDANEFSAEYSGGTLNVTSTYYTRFPSFLHFAAGTKVASAGGAATFTISGAAAGYDYTIKDWFDGDVVVNDVTVNSDGTLANDVYIAFELGHGTFLDITVGSEKKLYSLDSYYNAGTMYNISAMSDLTEIKVGMVIASDGQFYATASDVPDGNRAEAMVAYLGSEAEGAAHGLAIALEDLGTSYFSWNDTGIDNYDMTATELVPEWAYDHYIRGLSDGWRRPSAYDWQLMFIGCGSSTTYVDELTIDNVGMKFSYGDLRTKLKAAYGVNADVWDYGYWSSTLRSSGTAWVYFFHSGEFLDMYLSDTFHVRAVLAF